MYECLHRIYATDGRISVGVISSNLSASSYQWALARVTVAWLFQYTYTSTIVVVGTVMRYHDISTPRIFRSGKQRSLIVTDASSILPVRFSATFIDK